MGWVTCSLRKQALNIRRENMNYRLIELSQKLQDLQTFGNNIADGMVSDVDASSVSSSYFGTQLGFMQQSSAIAYRRARQETDAYLQQAGYINQGTGGQYTLAANGEGGNVNASLIFNDRYKKAMEECSKEIQKRIKDLEIKISNEKNTLETQLKAVDAEYEAMDKAIESDIKRSAIKLA